MLEVLTHRFPFKKKEVWFYNGESIAEPTYTSYCYFYGNFNLKYDYELKELTTVLDLTRNENELFSAINTTFKYEIKKAERMDFQYNAILNPTGEDCKKVVCLFGLFAKEKKIPAMNKKRITALQKSNNIIITRIVYKQQAITHVYLHDKKTILLMHSFHDPGCDNKKLRGFANKYHHWKDILLFKKMDFIIYDMGGINPEKVPGISKFKLGFGGTVKQMNNYTRIRPPFKFFFQLYRFILS